MISISFNPVSAGFFDDFITGDSADHPYNNGDYGLDEWIDLIEGSLSDIETTRSASEYIQDIVKFLISFISIVAVLYIMYAGFQILIWNGDEEKLKKSRTTIVYVAIWIIVIWLAWPITKFILTLLNI
jgi:Na+-driven multidrug efflux pump